MKTSLLMIAVLIFSALAVRLEHQAWAIPHLQAQEQKPIQWKSADVANLTDAEKHVDEVIRSLVGELKGHSLSSVQIDDDKLSHFIFNYTTGSDHTDSIKGTVDGQTISFKTPQGLEVTRKIIKKKNPSGKEYELTNIQERLVKKVEGKNGLRESSSFVSLTYAS